MLEALLEREGERAMSDVAAARPMPPIAGDPADILVDSITSWLEAVRRHPDTWRLILLPADGTPPSLRTNVERNRKLLLRQMEPLIAWGAPQLGLGHLDAELAAHAILAGAENAARLALTQPRRYTPERLAGFAADVLAVLAN